MRDKNLLLSAIVCFILGIIPFLFLGCDSSIDQEKAFVVFTKGASGGSNDPLKFQKPLIAIKSPYSDLSVGQFVVREDRIGFGYKYVVHQLTKKLPDGTWMMQGYNSVTNPFPDDNYLTPNNYIGVVYPMP